MTHVFIKTDSYTSCLNDACMYLEPLIGGFLAGILEGKIIGKSPYFLKLIDYRPPVLTTERK